jgi:hypothetical protein
MPANNVIIGDAIGRGGEGSPWEPEQKTPRAHEDGTVTTKDETETQSQAATDEPLTSPLQGNDQVANDIIEEEESPVKKLEALPANDNDDKEEWFSQADPDVIGETAKATAENPSHENGTNGSFIIQTSVASHESTMSPETPSDMDLIYQALELFQDDRLLEAVRLLRKVKDKTLLEENHRQILSRAETFEAKVADLTSSPSEGWTKQSESHGRYDTVIYYKVDDAARLTARIETPIEPSLLAPLISVFNESELYETWIPHFSYPKMGVKKSVKLRQTGRCNQIIAVTSYMPWPIADRECVFDATAVDDIDANGHIVVKMETRHQGEEDGLIPPPEKGIVRIDFDGAILMRKCPQDHVSLAKSITDHRGNLILVTLTMFCDAHIKCVPQSLINFVTRTVIGRIWGMLLGVAEEIRDGKRPLHAEAIHKKREHLYEWVDERIATMLDGIDEAKLAQP